MKTAQEARELLNGSRFYLETILSEIENEVIHQATQGQNWAHVNIKSTDSYEFIERVKDELCSLGYNVSEMNSAYNFTIKW